MLAQGRALYRSARLNAPLVSLLERRKASSFRLQTAAPFCLLRRELRRCETHAKLTTWFRNVSQNRSANNGLEINSRTENSNTKETPVAVPRKLRLQQDEYDLDENGYLVVEELVSFLRKEGALDMCVIEASGNRRSYVDYFVVVSGASTRHIRAMAKNLEQLFRGHEVRGLGQTSHVVAEGLDADDWMVVDIGNCVVHFFLPETRQVFELEKLWLLGPRYDDQYKAMLEEEEFLKASYTGKRLDAKESDGSND